MIILLSTSICAGPRFKNLKWVTSELPVTREQRPGMSPNLQTFAQDCSEEERGLGYSYRSATIGSTRMARRAGMQQAASAMIISKPATDTKVIASVGRTP